MDSGQQQSQNLELELEVGEDVRISLDSIEAKIESTQFPENRLEFGFGKLSITSSRVVFVGIERSIQLDYQKVITHGIQENCLVCYLLGQEQNETDEEQDEEILNEQKEYLEFISRQSKEETISLQGDFEVRFSFASKTLEELKQAFMIFNECSALNPDEEDNGASLANLIGGGGGNIAGFDFDSMVTAQDIDENGNLIAGHPLLNGGEDNEDEDEEEEYTDDEEEEENQNNNNGNTDDKHDKEDKNGMEIE